MLVCRLGLLDHNSDLCACCAGVKSSSKPSLVPAKPLHPRNVAWRSSLVANFNSTASRRVLATTAEACVIASCYRVATTTLACNLIWPYNSFVLSCYTIFFSVLPSLALKPMRRRLSLWFSCLGMSARVSIA